MYKLSQIMKPQTTKGLNSRKNAASEPVQRREVAKAVKKPQEPKTENVHSLLAEKRIRELTSQDGYQVQIMATGKLQSTPHPEPVFSFLKDVTIDSFNETQNGRFWGLSRKVVDGKQIVQIWVLVPPQEAQK